MMRTVILETYGDLGAKARTQIEHEDVSGAWILLDKDKIVGVAIVHDCWLSDLWVLREYRGQGAGAQLIARAENDIADRGYSVAFLRVVKANTRAVAFYQKAGWNIEAEFPHETLTVEMLRMRKDVRKKIV